MNEMARSEGQRGDIELAHKATRLTVEVTVQIDWKDVVKQKICNARTEHQRPKSR